MKHAHQSILIINPFGIGDVLFSTPLLQNLCDNFPRAKILFLCNRRTAPILKNHPLISKIFVYERDEFVAVQQKSFWAGLKKYCHFISEIKKEEIDCAIDLSLNTLFGFFTWAAGIRYRYGLDYKNRGRFLTQKLKIDGFLDKHVSEYYLDVLKLMYIPIKKYGLSIGMDKQSQRWVDSFLTRYNFTNDFIVGIAPFGGEAFGKDAYFKRWPVEHFVKLIDRINVELKAKIFIFAGPKEKGNVSVMMSSIQNKNSCYEFTDASLEKIIALIDKCHLFVGNDTGPLRFADALDKKILAIFGPVDEKVYGPYPADKKKVVITKNLPCRPCYKKFRMSECLRDRECLKSISVDEVFAAVRRLL
ncbi:MAG: glycosyltransferase family 9 protein [Candidatus Omnitrophica bacterium]|nr:glycosyltransferase family 9 protein [Candidatus Omnitrophota bacterium]